jgi:prepilin-type N-terminal cleavage/methylation domain-containing protein
MNAPRHSNGFTLVELILVMALLSTMMAVAAPSLSNFFSGRGLEEETRRFLAVTRHARNEAISTATVVEMWIDLDERAYGLSPHDPYTPEVTEARRYHVARGLTLEIDPESIDEDGRATITFWPDGLLDTESVEKVTIRENENRATSIKRNEFTPGYRVSDEDDEEK